MNTRSHTRTALALAAAMLAIAPTAAQASIVQGSGAAPSSSVGRTGEDVRLGTQTASHRGGLFAQTGRTGEDARLVAVPHEVQAVRDFPSNFRPATVPAAVTAPPFGRGATSSAGGQFDWTGALILSLMAGATLLVLIGANKLLTGSIRRPAPSA